MADPMVLRRVGRQRGAAARSVSWWGRAWVRTCEETTVDAADLVAARTLARSGRLGAIVVISGMASAVVDPGEDDPRTPQVKVDRLGERDWRRVGQELVSEAGHLAALESGELSARLVEQIDETGVELLPGPADLETACDCGAWVQPCVHALALLYQLARHLDADPYVLLLLRGRTRERLLADADSPTPASIGDAAERAAAIVRLAERAPAGHGLADAEVAAYDEAVAALVPRPERDPGPSVSGAGPPWG